MSSHQASLLEGEGLIFHIRIKKPGASETEIISVLALNKTHAITTLIRVVEPGTELIELVGYSVPGQGGKA